MLQNLPSNEISSLKLTQVPTFHCDTHKATIFLLKSIYISKFYFQNVAILLINDISFYLFSIFLLSGHYLLFGVSFIINWCYFAHLFFLCTRVATLEYVFCFIRQIYHHLMNNTQCKFRSNF